ncbi:acyl-CoA dehydrogenase family protein [uncultured Oscillibacter sp.]|uniref:acyl-CoA dehydrogenase family protein n=1 Tax=uncultured Oscillibacter sp. TaxID=876091 RepID=UPI0028058783|nr:acyl-CoA dehydrogenase family protein [uncultured Oscillibacter sp.]
MKWYMNEDREMLQNAFREFAQTKVRPHVDQMEKEEADAGALLKEMGKLGFFALGKPEEYGGAGNDHVNVGLLMEELAKESYTVGFLALIQHMFIQEMIKCCSPEQIQKYAVPAMNGDIVLGLASCEPAGSMHFEGYSTKAIRDGDTWVINGNKCLITEVDVADVFIVSALTGDHFDITTGEGYGTFIVPADTKGISIGHIENKVGWKGSRTGTIYFNDVRFPAENLIPTPMFLAPAHGLGGYYAALDLGGAERCLEKTTAILKERVQTGNRSLWDAHEAIRHNVADLTVKVSVFKNAVYSHMMNLTIGQADFIEDFALKMEGAKLLREISSECMILAGGAGMIYETGIERYYRDVQPSEVGCGCNKTALDWISALL